MRPRSLLFVAITFILLLPLPVVAAEYHVEKVSDGVYAAVAIPGGKAVSNALMVIADQEVILAGAHFTRDGIAELIGEIGKLTPLPLRHIILTHHHRGYNYFDYDLPPTAEIITSWQCWQAIKAGYREMKNPVTVLESGLTLQRGKLSIVLRNTDRGHSEGDVIVFLPESQVLFTSDLVFNDTVGFMGDGHMREWVADLQVLENLRPRVVVPGVGKVTDGDGIKRFRLFLQDFFTELLRHLEKNETVGETKARFALPAYEGMRGYVTFYDVNIERGYEDLKGK